MRLHPLPTAAAALALVLAVTAGAQQQQQQQQSKPDLARPGSSFAPKSRAGKWQTIVSPTPEGGFLIGNPEAKGRLTATMSYTCPECADFTARGEQALDLVLVMPGEMSLELRPAIRNGLDVTATLLARCGDPAGFRARHRALMAAQGRWLAKARGAPASQQAIWERGDRAARMNAANALGLTALLARSGQSTAALDACVSDDAAAAMLRKAAAPPGARLPAFALDGKPLAGVHDWEALYPLLSTRFAKRAP